MWRNKENPSILGILDRDSRDSREPYNEETLVKLVTLLVGIELSFRLPGTRPKFLDFPENR